MNLKRYRWSKFLQLAVLLWAVPLQAQKFYPDDPLTQEPAPFPVDAANFRGLNPLYEMVMHQFGKPGERHPANGVIPALSANTLGEVMDGLWFVNRHARQRLSATGTAGGFGPRRSSIPPEEVASADSPKVWNPPRTVDP